MTLIGDYDTLTQVEAAEIKVKAALRDAIRAHMGASADYYRGQLAELDVLRDSLTVPEQRAL